jgi:hypothetical protein
MASMDRFKQVEDEYFRLKGQLATGRITPEQFEAALKPLMLQDAQGRYWMLGSKSATWKVYERDQWVEADPYATAAAPPLTPSRPTDLAESAAAPVPPPRPIDLPESATASRPRAVPQFASPPPRPTQTGAPVPARSRGGGCGSCLLYSALLIIVLIVLLGGGGFLAFRSGALTVNTLLHLVGLGPAQIEVNNFRDDHLQVSITPASASQTSTPSGDTLSLNAFDINSYRVTNPGKYRVDFATSDGATLGTCTLNLRGGDHYQFVALPEKIIVNRVNDPPTVGTDLILETSSFCR